MFKKVLISGMLLSVMLGSGWMMTASAAPATDSAMPQPTDSNGSGGWQQYMKQGDVLAAEATKMTRADHNPKKKDYYQAAKLYSQAAVSYQQARSLLSAPNFESAPNAEEVKEAAQLDKKAQKMEFQSRSAFSTARRLDMRNMD